MVSLTAHNPCQIRQKTLPQFRAPQGILYRGFQKAFFVAYVITAAFEIIRIHGLDL